MNMKRVIVLNNAYDVTENVKSRILNNDLDVLKINYNCDEDTPSPFYDLEDLTEINFEIELGENVKSMFAFFYNCKSLKAIPLFDTKNVTDMSYMFSDCDHLEIVPFFNTKNVKNMSEMFAFCSSLKSVPRLNTQNCGNTKDMFVSCPDCIRCNE